MYVLRVEHPVRDFDAWKEAFDSDPVGRERGGVRRYSIMRAADDPNRVLIDLDFEERTKAETFLEGLKGLWSRVDVIRDPRARIVERVESKEL